MTTSFLVSSAVRAGVVLLAGHVAVRLLARASASTRRAVLVLTLGASLVVPLAAAVAPSWRVATPAVLEVMAHESPLEGGQLAETAPGVSPEAALPEAFRSRGPRDLLIVPVALWALWLTGALLVLGRAYGSFRRARALVGQSARASGAAWDRVITSAVREAGAVAEVRLSKAVDSPAVTGVLRSTILLPRGAEEWSDARRRIVLVHELAHVRRRDGVAQVVADAACAFHWYNPLVWRCARRLRVERELAADDAVLLLGVRPSFYAEELLAHAGAEARGALGMAERSSLAARLVAILTAEHPRRDLAPRGQTLLGGATVVVAVAAACTLPTARAQEAPTGTTLDPKLQAAAEDEVTALLTVTAGEAATVVVLDPASGKVLANAGRRHGQPFDMARRQALVPGSTLKAVTLAAAVETGSITPGQRFACGPEARAYPDGAVEDYATHGLLDAPHLLAVSSNVGISHVFDALGGEHLNEWLGRFHFGQALALPGAAPGFVPAALATGSLRGAEVATGESMTATPLQIAAAYATLANDGVYHAPTVEAPPAPAERVVSSATARQLMSMLAVVVDDETGTGIRARVEGTPVAGKTGTAVWNATDGKQHSYVSFVGVADLPGRRIVALVGVETLRKQFSGPETAAPAFAHLVSRLR